MAIERWSPLRDVTSLREAMDRMLEEAMVSPRGMGEREPLLGVDLYEQDDSYILEAPLPGIRPEDVEITASGNTVTITGQIPCPTTHEKGPRYLMHQRVCGRFSRHVTVPSDIDAGRAEASFEHGLLRLTMPKAETARSRRIEVKTAGR